MIDENRKNMSIFRIEQAKECLVMAKATVDTSVKNAANLLEAHP